MASVVGIDVGKMKLDVCVLKGEQVREAQFDNNATGFGKLRRWLKKNGVKGAAVCLEATGMYGDPVAEYLHENGYTVSIVNPARIKAFAEAQLARNKTDKLDARRIADFATMHRPDPWTPPDPALKELRAMVRHLDDLVNIRQQERNRLDSGVRSTTVIDNLKAHIRFLDAQIEQLQQRIHDHIDHHPDLKQQRDLLVSIKGIGDLTAARLLAEIRFDAFDSPRQVVAFAGLNPRHFTSGTSINKPTRISKRGRASIRAALYFPAIAAKKHNPLIKPLCDRMAAQGHVPLSCVVAAMRKLLHLAFGVLKSGQPFDPNFLQKSTQLA